MSAKNNCSDPDNGLGAGVPDLLWAVDNEAGHEHATSANEQKIVKASGDFSRLQNAAEYHAAGEDAGDNSEFDNKSNVPLQFTQHDKVEGDSSDACNNNKNRKTYEEEMDDIFEGLGNFGASRDADRDEPNPFDFIIPDEGKEALSSLISDETGQLKDPSVVSSASSQDTSTHNSNSSVNESNNGDNVERRTPVNQAATAATQITPIHRRNSSTSRRRHCNIRHMESISETPSSIHTGEETKEFEDVDLSSEGFIDHDNDTSEQSHQGGNNNGDLLVQRSRNLEVNPTDPASFSTPRRRIRVSGESVSSAGNSSNSTGSGGGSRGSSRRFRSRRGRNQPSNNGDNAEQSDDTPERRGRSSSNSGNSIVASLDAGMASLRCWLRARRLSPGPGSAGAGSSSVRSVSSMTTMRLGEEDIFALSHTGSDTRRARSVTSASSDPNRDLFESNSSNGYMYYRPYEVHVRHDVDIGSEIYGSDDESGSRSILLHPLVSSIDSSSLGEGSQQSRTRAQSEPDRARVQDFFSTVYGARAIDGSHTQSESGTTEGYLGNRGALHHSQHGVRHTVSTSPIIFEEDADVRNQETGLLGGHFLSPSTHGSIQLQLISRLDVDEGSPDTTSSPSAGNDAESRANVALETTSNNDIAADNVSDATSNESASADPDRQARARWIRINKRFKCIITSVAVLFSLLLFFIVISWVILAATYVLSHKKTCDVPLRAYFWLVSAQLMLDIFRSDIQKWLCRWRSDSGRRVPPRIILYNLSYLVYAMFVLRTGVRSVCIADTTCDDTAPELFYASVVFVALSLLAWATILLGYLIPFFFVAFLLTRNGYFPNGNLTSSRGVMGGRRARIGTGRISEMVGEAFPNTVSNPAPAGTVEALPVVFLNEFPESYQKECCICMMEYKESEVIVQTPCDHIFHKRCCQEWLTLSRTCPVCRLDLPQVLGIDEGEGVSLSGSERGGRTPNIMRYLRRQRRQAADSSTTSNHPEGIVEIELPETANDALHRLERGDNQSNHSAQVRQLDA